MLGLVSLFKYQGVRALKKKQREELYMEEGMQDLVKDFPPYRDNGELEGFGDKDVSTPIITSNSKLDRGDDHSTLKVYLSQVSQNTNLLQPSVLEDPGARTESEFSAYSKHGELPRKSVLMSSRSRFISFIQDSIFDASDKHEAEEGARNKSLVKEGITPHLQREIQRKATKYEETPQFGEIINENSTKKRAMTSDNYRNEIL